MTVNLDINAPPIQYLCKKDKRLARVISTVGPISYETHEDSYSFMVHEIIEQMLSVKAGAKIYERLEELCHGPVTVAAVNSLSDEQLVSIGTSAAKAGYIRGITDAVISGKLDYSSLELLSDGDVVKTLTAFRGIGSWTAKMYLIFVLDRQDVLPTEDVAFLQAYEWLYKTKDRSRSSVEKRCKKWKPYSSIASRYLYRALDSGLTKKEFHLYKLEEV